jgi:cephalosporin-C deacetylase-like acetyl esterase
MSKPGFIVAGGFEKMHYFLKKLFYFDLGQSIQTVNSLKNISKTKVIFICSDTLIKLKIVSFDHQ